MQTWVRHLSDYLVKNGLRDLTLDTISERSGLSHRTIEHEYQDVQGVLRQMVLEDIEEYRRALELVRNMSVLNPIQEIVEMASRLGWVLSKFDHKYFSDIQDLYPKHWNLYKDFIYSYGGEILISNINRGIQDSWYRKDLNLSIIVSLALVQIESYFNPIYVQKNIPLSDIFMEGSKYYLHGICSNKGLQFLQTAYKF